MNKINITNYLRKLLKEIDENNRITKDALHLLEKFVITAGSNIAREASFLASGQIKGKPRTLKLADIETAVKICFTGEIKDIISEDIEKAVAKYKSTKSGGAAKRAGLVIPPPRVKPIFQDYHSGRMSSDSSVALAVVMEYIGYEILKLSSRIEGGKKTIDVDKIYKTIENDVELREIAMNVDWKKENVKFRSPKKLPQI